MRICVFTSLDVEMEITSHFSEVMDVVDRLFVAIFDRLNEKCSKELEAIARQYPFQPLKYLKQTLRLEFEEGIRMLLRAGMEVNPLRELNTEAKRKLGQLVFEEYRTEFYILHHCPSDGKPSYTMKCHDDQNYSYSFDVFIRGEEIISGGQRVHDAMDSILGTCLSRLDAETIASYKRSCRFGIPPHGGFEGSLERVVMLFCGLEDIRMAALFPPLPSLLAP